MIDWLNTAFAGFDMAILEFAHMLSGSGKGFSYYFFNFFTFLGEGGWFAIVCSVIALLFKSTRKVGCAVLIGLLFGTIINNEILKNIFNRQRPYVANETYAIWHQHVGATLVSSNSFPSGHSACTMSATIAWILTSKKKYRFLGFIYALIMGFSRLFLMVHYPTDVIAGFIVGAVTGTLAYLLVKGMFYLLEKYKDKKVINAILDFSIVNLFKKEKAE